MSFYARFLREHRDKCIDIFGLTPTKHNEFFDARLFWEHGDGDEHVEVDALGEDPHVARTKDVVEHREEQLTLPVLAVEIKYIHIYILVLMCTLQVLVS